MYRPVCSKNLFWFSALLLAFALSVPGTRAADKTGNGKVPEPDSPPMSPEETLAVSYVPDGFEIELVAAEPLVVDPVAIAWGADGKLWVAEMIDYPMGMDGKGKPGGQIKFLEDTDGDGKYDSATLFLDKVPFPNGLLPWGSGLLVTAAPDIFFAEDTNGDGKADRREVLFTGFQEGNQQLRVNGLQRGLDNWVYCASGAHHGGYGADRSIKAVKAGKKIDLGSRDFRFRPDTGEIDPQSGPSQFGRNRDDWGNWFGEQNSFPLWHYVLNDDYMRRNPHIASPDPRVQVVGPRNPKVYPAKTPQKRFHSFEQSGRFTSACSAMIYRDELLFPRNRAEHAFTCEPFHNLVQHNIIEEEGVSFKSHRDPRESERDFFASKDRWCRPVFVTTGPDGALWIVDMYRYMIEHPQWLTPEGREELKPFYRHGENKGRIYRVYPKGKRPRPIPRFINLSIPELVAALDSPNGQQRDIVQQLLVEKADRSAVEPLEQLAFNSPNPLARLHALCTLEGLNAASVKVVTQLLRDQSPGVRRQAIRVAEPLGKREPRIIAAAVKMVNDPDAKVRLQLACTLGEWPGTESARALAYLAIHNANDFYISAALTSSINSRNLGEILKVALQQRQNAEAGRLVGQLLALSVAFENRQATFDGLATILELDNPDDLPWQYETVAGLLDALQKRKTTLESLASQEGKRGKKLVQQVSTLIENARQLVLDRQATEALRIAAVRLLARNPAQRAADIQILGQLLTPQVSPAIQKAVVRHLGTLTDPAISQVLLTNWRSYGPATRAEVLGVLSTRSAWLSDLLDAIENGDLARADIDASTRQSLLVYRDKKIRARIKALLSDANSGNRQQVIQKYQSVLQLKGNPGQGAVVFKKHCAACHKLEGVGYDIGPNLWSITDTKPANLLTDILDPSAGVDGKYVTYVAVTEDGRTFSGMMGTETGNSITLVAAENKRQVILRSDLEELQSTGKSLMPDGLEKEISPQNFADLIAYIRKKGK